MNMPYVIGFTRYPYGAQVYEKNLWAANAKERIQTHFKWSHTTLPSCFWRFIDFEDCDFDAVVDSLSAFYEKLPVSTDVQRIFPVYSRSPREAIRIITDQQLDREGILLHMEQAQQELRCFCKRYGMLYATEEEAINDICKGPQTAEVVSAFCFDKATTNNFTERFKEVEKKKVELRRRFQLK